MSALKSVPSDLVEKIAKSETIIVLGHERPDIDCIGSQLALSSFLNHLGKTVHTVSAGPFTDSEKYWSENFQNTLPPLSDDTLIIFVDCDSPSRTGFDKEIGSHPYIAIDHHLVSLNETEGSIFYIDSQSPSSTLLVQNLIESMGKSLNLQEAEWIYLGFCYDSGFFRHIRPEQSGVFSYIERLVAAGVDPRRCHQMLVGGKSLGSRYLLARLIERLESHFKGRLMITYEPPQDRNELKINKGSSSALYDALFEIDEVECIVYIHEEEGDRCNVGFRSRNNIDVSRVAATFGGGGHKNAAGCSIKGDHLTVKQQILHRIQEMYYA